MTKQLRAILASLLPWRNAVHWMKAGRTTQQLFGLGANAGLDGRGLDGFGLDGLIVDGCGLDGLRRPAKAGISNCRGCPAEGCRSLSLRGWDVGYGGDCNCWSPREVPVIFCAPLLDVLLQRLVAELGHLVGVCDEALELVSLSLDLSFVTAGVPRVRLGVLVDVDILPGDGALLESLRPSPGPTLETDERLGVLADIGVALRKERPVSALVFLRGSGVGEAKSMLEISASSFFRISKCSSSVSI
mmetsp:Transcript_112206/g.198761  ORF Transcript_112206/g.198761 Transcript_112206/m.198761 type:complete len:245 (-) Transcript_112206:359-1093(-)